jgi:PsbP-like protein
VKTGALTIKSTISVILASVLIAQIFSVMQLASTSNNNNYDGILQSSLAQSDTTTTAQAGGQDPSAVLIQEIEKVLTGLGYNISPSGVPTTKSLPLEFGIRPRGIMQPVVPGSSGVIAVQVWDDEVKAQTFSKERFDLSTMGRNSISDKRNDGVVWYILGGSVYYGPLNNKIEYSGSASGEFVCGKLTLSAEETIISDPVDMPAGGIQGPDALRGGGENQNYKNMKLEGDKISKKASDDLAQRLQSIVVALNSKGLCMAAAPQPQQQQLDQTCPAAPNLLQNTSASTSQDNVVKLAGYASGELKTYQNPHIIKVAQEEATSTTAKKSGPLTYNYWPWRFTYEVIDKEGLVITEMTAGGQTVFKSLSVPHFKIESLKGASKIVRFDQANDEWCTLVKAKKIDNNRDEINWWFERKFNEPDINGTLRIDYSIVIWTSPLTNCEKGAGFNCYRFVPKVNFTWDQSKHVTVSTRTDLNRFTAFYRLDYGPVGFALTKDEDSFPSFVTNNLYRQDIQTQEIKFDAVKDGAAGTFDNIHTVHENEQVIIPGCGRSSWHFILAAFKVKTVYNAFDCVHIHWRWSESNTYHPTLGTGIKVDPVVEPSDNSQLPYGEHDRGKPNLVPGQTIQVGILRQDTLPPGTPKDPDDPLDLIKMDKPKTIATTYPKDIPKWLLGLEEFRPEKRLKSLTDENNKPTSTIVWYVASWNHDIRKEQKDTFFRHGIFVIDPKTKKAELETIRSNLQGLAMSGSEDKKAGLLAQMDGVLGNDNWSADGNSLADQKGESVFTGLSQVAASLVEARNKTPEIVDPVLSELLTAAQDIVNTHLQNRIVNTVASLPGSQPEFEKLFAENQAIKQAIEKYVSSSNESDITQAALIVDGFKQSWLNGVKGISEVSTKLGILPTPPQDNATTTTATNKTTTPIDANKTTTTTTGAGQQQQPQRPLSPPTLSVASIKLLPESSPHFFKCNETPTEGSPTLPRLDVESSANTAITDGDPNTEMLGKAIFDITFDSPLENNAGPDFAVHEVGSVPESFKVASVNAEGSASNFKDYTGSTTGSTDDCGFEIFSAQIDLSDVGIEEDDTISTIRIDNNGAPECCTGADISDVLVINEAPSSGAAITPLSPTTTGQQQPPPLQPSSPSQTDATTTTESKFTDYFSAALKMSMKYPLDWIKTETANSVVLTSKQKDESDQSLERLDIFYHQDIPLFATAVETLEKNAQKAIDDQKTLYNNLVIKDSKDIIIGGLPAKRVVYTYTTTTQDVVDEYSAMAIIIVNQNDLYKIFFSAKSDHFYSDLPIAERIIDSIRFTESSAGNIPETSSSSTTTTSAAPVQQPEVDDEQIEDNDNEPDEIIDIEDGNEEITGLEDGNDNVGEEVDDDDQQIEDDEEDEQAIDDEGDEDIDIIEE